MLTILYLLIGFTALSIGALFFYLIGKPVVKLMFHEKYKEQIPPIVVAIHGLLATILLLILILVSYVVGHAIAGFA